MAAGVLRLRGRGREPELLDLVDLWEESQFPPSDRESIHFRSSAELPFGTIDRQISIIYSNSKWNIQKAT